MRAHPPKVRRTADRRTLSRQSFFTFDPQNGEELLLPYRGGLLSAVVVDGIGGYYKPGISSYDALCRSQNGDYLLVREVTCDRWSTGNGGRPAFPLPAGFHWLRVKRLSQRAAMLHATRDCSYLLRQDLWDAMAPALNATARGWLDRYTAETGATPAAVISAAVAYVLDTAYDPCNGGGPHDDHRRGEFWRWFAEKVKEVAS